MKRTIGVLAMLLLTSICGAEGLGYDPQLDPFDQYQQAIDEAAASHKLVLIVAGGDWCRWCYVLSRFVEKNKDVEERLEDTFVVMKVYVGPDNYNEMFFSQLPQAYGAPHFWIVSPQREVLASQSTASLEKGKSTYDKASFLAFIERWKHASLERHAQIEAAPSLHF